MNRLLRARTAMLVVLGLVFGGIAAAAFADGESAIEVATNDGGAWLVNSKRGAVGHVNRAVMELTSALAITDLDASLVVSQAEGSLVAHVPETGAAIVVDDQLTRVANTFVVDLDWTVEAIAGGVMVADPAEGKVWALTAVRATEIPSLSSETPALTANEPVRVLVGVDGGGHALGLESGRVWRVGIVETVELADPLSEEPDEASRSATVVGDRVIVFDGTGFEVVSEAKRIRVEAAQPQGFLPQQPSPEASFLAGSASDGSIVQIDLVTGQISHQTDLGEERSVPPVVTGGCVFALARQLGQLHRICGDEVISRDLSANGSNLTLRLVNGWVWVNDLDSGTAWSIEPDGELNRADDWGTALGDKKQDETASGEDTTIDISESLVNNPDDVTAQVVGADRRDNDATNEPPKAEPDSVTTRRERPVVIRALANDTDQDGDVLMLDSVDPVNPVQGRMEIAADRRSVQFVPARGFIGTVTTAYTISDGRGEHASSTITVEVVSDELNRPPEAVTDIASTRAGESVTVNVLANDSDPDGDSIVLTNISAPEGSVVFSPDGEVTYFPVAEGEGARLELPYTVTDDRGDSTEGKLVVSIRPANSNNEPDARNDAAVTSVGSIVSLDVLLNDFDPDGDPLTVIKPPDDIRATLSSDGRFLFRPEAPGTYIFSYTISDGSESDSAYIRVEVTAPETNSPPVPLRDDATVYAGAAVTVFPLSNDGDPDGDVVGLVDWMAPSNVQAEVIEGNAIRFTIPVDAPSQITIDYSITDGFNDPVWSAIVLAVTPQRAEDSPPVARADFVDLRPGIPVLVDLLRNDFDPEGTPITLVAVSAPSGGTAEAVGNRVRVMVDPDAESGFTFTYTIADTPGNTASALVTVRVVPSSQPNRAPVASPDIRRVRGDRAIPIEVLANDWDPDGDGLILTAVGQPNNGQTTITGRLAIYQPDRGFEGTDSFWYEVRDEWGERARGLVVVGVLASSVANFDPVANDDSFRVRPGVVDKVLPVLANDSDADSDPLVVTDVEAPDGLGVSLAGGGAAIAVTAPPVDVPTPFVVRYTVTDGRGGFDQARVSIVVDPELASSGPVAVDDLVGPIKSGTVATFSPLENDYDPDGGAQTLRVIAVPEEFVANLDGTYSVIAPDLPTRYPYQIADEDGNTAIGFVSLFVVDNLPPVVETTYVQTLMGESVLFPLTHTASDPDGDPLVFGCCDNVRGGFAQVVSTSAAELAVEFIPSDGFRGTGGFSFTVEDGRHMVTASVIVDVRSGTNLSPEFRDGVIRIPANRSRSVLISDFVTDPEQDPIKLSVDGDPGKGVSAVVNGRFLVVSVSAAAPQNSVVEIPLVADDGHSAPSRGKLTIEVLKVEDTVPVARPDDGFRVYEGQSIEIPVLANDDDPIGDGLTVVEVGFSEAGDTAVGPDARSAVFTPKAGFSGSAVFTYTIQDATGLPERRASSHVKVDVVGLPGPPDRPSVKASSQTVAVTWLAPRANGGTLGGYLLEMEGPKGVESREMGVSNGYTWDGLTNGVEYRFRVTASNEAGRSEASEWSVAVRPDIEPGTPGAPTLEFGDEQITIRWTAPANAGSPITAYYLRSSDGVVKPLSGGLNQHVWTGLTNGTAYTFAVQAENLEGKSPWSASSAPETPARQPDKPLPPTGTRGSQRVDLTWAEPVLNGAPVLEYRVRILPGGSEVSITPATSYRWSDLPNGVEVRFQIQARNKAGWSLWSDPSNTVVPADRPNAPAIDVAIRGDRQATVQWRTPASNGAIISQYRITASSGSVQFAPGEATLDALNTLKSFTFGGLTNGTAYTFTVVAINDVGESTPSGASNSVTPAGPPGIPVLSGSNSGIGEVTLNWTAPTDNGSPITGYVVTTNGGSPLTVTGTTTTISGLMNGTSYAFRVRAANGVGQGELSNQVLITTWAAPSQPAAPAVSSGNGSATVSWVAPNNGGSAITGYNLEHDRGGSVAVSGSPYSWGGLANGTAYRFRVQACNAIGCSSWSTWSASVTPNPPRGIVLSVGGRAPCGNCYYAVVSAYGFPANTQFQHQCQHQTSTGSWTNSTYNLWTRYFDSNGGYYNSQSCWNGFGQNMRVRFDVGGTSYFSNEVRFPAP